MGKTFNASVDWLGMIENGGVLPGQDVDPSVNGGKAQDGTEVSSERERFIKFLKDNEGGYDYIRNKNSAIKKMGEDGEWDGESYYKIFDEGTQKYYPYFLDDEKGATIGHGHHNDDVYETYKDGITIERAEELLNLDVDNKMSDTEIWWTNKYGDEEWDKLDESTQYLLGDMAYNTGHIRNYKIFADAIKRGDFKTAEEHYSRGTSVGGPRLGRNKTYMAEYLKPWMDVQKEKIAVAPDELSLPIGVYPTDLDGNPIQEQTKTNNKKETSWWRGEEGIVPDELQWWKHGGQLPKAHKGGEDVHGKNTPSPYRKHLAHSRVLDEDSSIYVPYEEKKHTEEYDENKSVMLGDYDDGSPTFIPPASIPLVGDNTLTSGHWSQNQVVDPNEGYWQHKSGEWYPNGTQVFSQGYEREDPTTWEVIKNVVANPIEAVARGFIDNGRDAWDGTLGEGQSIDLYGNNPGPDGFNFVNEVINPAKWVENIDRSLDEGNYTAAGTEAALSFFPWLKPLKLAKGTSKITKKADYFNNNSLITSGRGQNVNAVIDANKRLKTSKNPIVYTHGTGSSSLPGVIDADGLVVRNIDETIPMTGELTGLGNVNHINKTHLSVAPVTHPELALNYSLGTSGPRNYLDEFNSFIDDRNTGLFTNEKNNILMGEGFTDKMYKIKYDRLNAWNNADDATKKILEENYPMLLGINPKNTVAGNSRYFSGISNQLGPEAAIKGGVKLDEISNVFVPNSRIQQTTDYFGDKIGNIKINSLEDYSSSIPRMPYYNDIAIKRLEESLKHYKKYGGSLPIAQDGWMDTWTDIKSSLNPYNYSRTEPGDNPLSAFFSGDYEKIPTYYGDDKDKAFSEARKELGGGKTFLHDGIRYKTDYAGETEHTGSNFFLANMNKANDDGVFDDWPGLHDRLIEVWTELGQPDLEMGTDKYDHMLSGHSWDEVGGNKSDHVNPLTDKLWIKAYKTKHPRLWMDAVINELTHVKQQREMGRGKYMAKYVKDLIGTLGDQHELYNKDGTLEHQAHTGENSHNDILSNYIYNGVRASDTKKKYGGSLPKAQNGDVEISRSKVDPKAVDTWEGGREFMQKWYTSPMAIKMMKEEDPENWQQLQAYRLENIREDLAKVKFYEYNSEPNSKNLWAWAGGSHGPWNIGVYPKGLSAGPSAGHEFTHLSHNELASNDYTDDWIRTGLPASINDGNPNAPTMVQTDPNFFKSYGKHSNWTNPYRNSNNPWNYEFGQDDGYRMSDEQYLIPQSTIDYIHKNDMSFKDKRGQQGVLGNVDKSDSEYWGAPSEHIARLNAIRYKAYMTRNQHGWDPLTMPLTDELWEKVKKRIQTPEGTEWKDENNVMIEQLMSIIGEDSLKEELNKVSFNTQPGDDFGTEMMTSKYGGQHNWALDLRSSTIPRAQSGKEVKSDDIYSNDRYSQSASKYKRLLPKYQKKGEKKKTKKETATIEEYNWIQI